MKKDPHNHENAYKKWQANGCQMQGVNPETRKIILEYLEDMELGANVNPLTKRGARSYGRLRNLKSKMHSIALIFQKEIGIESISEMQGKEKELLLLAKKMRDGKIYSRRYGNKPLAGVGAYMKAFQSFWNWYQRKSRKDGIEIKNILGDIDTRENKPKFNYFTLDQLKVLCDYAKNDYKVMMSFLFDSGMRAPTEMLNAKVSDLSWNSKENYYVLNIREETSKTFGREIKLLLCSQMLREYLESYNFKINDFIFKKTPQRVNQYLKNLGYNNLGIGKKSVRGYGEKKYSVVVDGITLYDFRHSSACYWLPRYKSESALKYRFGWKKSEMIHYYTELLGMRDTIGEEDLYIDVSKTKLENEIKDKGRKIEVLNERLHRQDKQMQEIMATLKALQLEKEVKI